MKTSLIKELRAILRGHPEGLSTPALADMTSRSNNSVRNTLLRMPDVYIDRWQSASQNKSYSAVWCIVVPPDHCPHPTRQVVAVRPRTRRDSREDEREAEQNSY